MSQSTTIGALAKALAAAQRAMKPAVRNSENPFYKSSYVDLAGAWEACREALSTNGLTVIQTTEDGGGAEGAYAHLVTTLAHESGEWIQGTYPVRPIKNDPQGLGSAMTYARRYALMAIVGLAPEDDDGCAASEPPPDYRKRESGKGKPPAAGKVTQPQPSEVRVPPPAPKNPPPHQSPAAASAEPQPSDPAFGAIPVEPTPSGASEKPITLISEADLAALDKIPPGNTPASTEASYLRLLLACLAAVKRGEVSKEAAQPLLVEASTVSEARVKAGFPTHAMSIVELYDPKRDGWAGAVKARLEYAVDAALGEQTAAQIKIGGLQALNEILGRP